MPLEKANQRFPKNDRLRKQGDFARVYDSKVFAADETLVMTGVSNGTPATRIGLAVSRKVGNAVVRNRWKRHIREAFRRLKPQISQGMDLVIRPRKGAKCDWQTIGNSLVSLAKQVDRKLKKSHQSR